MTISSDIQAAVSVQEYVKKPRIEGVEFLSPPFHSDDTGNFTEVARLGGGQYQGLNGFEVKQVNMSLILPGVIKAFHFHEQQDDLWYVSPYERLLLNMIDGREGSPTQGEHVRLVLGAGSNTLVRIPAGVIHGAGNLWTQPVNLLYFVTNQFNPESPDEKRLPWDHFGEAMWQVSRG